MARLSLPFVGSSVIVIIIDIVHDYHWHMDSYQQRYRDISDHIVTCVDLKFDCLRHMQYALTNLETDELIEIEIM